jgi:hypothetical protein
MTARVRYAVLAVGLVTAACDPRGDGGSASEGARLYAELCASCHGREGRGDFGPPLRAWSKGRPTLVQTISERMPLTKPGTCTGGCAESIADYILTAFRDPLDVPSCDGTGAAVALGKRRLRQLTRAELRATVRDLFSTTAGAAPTCKPTLWRYVPPAGSTPRTVHVAGSFNGWAGTIAAGGWAMRLDSGAWVLERALPVGHHAYKFVLDESRWIPDPANPASEDDHYGGRNSVLDVTCDANAPAPPGGGGLSVDIAAALPAESRPDGYPFANEADAQRVTAVYVDELRAAARRIADEVVGRDLVGLVGCDGASDPGGCAQRFVERFGLRAFRRPLTADEVARYRDLITAPNDFKRGVKRAVAAMLQSPHFLYRSEIGTLGGDGDARLSGYEIASLLSYTFWGSMPDDALFEAARTGELDRPDGITTHARRLLADPRAREAVGAFALSWLGAEPIFTADKKPDLFPMVTPSLRAKMAEETRRFVAHVVFDGSHRLEELLTADFTFADRDLAALYGLPGVTSTDLQRVPYGDGRRAGIFGHASVLGTYAHSDQSSPILRGLFVRRRLLCQDLPPPPPNAGGVPEVDPNATTRERFRQHTANPFCAQCHKYIDMVGFGLERFDAIGRWRETENDQPIPADGDMNDVERLGAGTSAPYSSVPELARTVASSGAATACFAHRWHQAVHGAASPTGEPCAERRVLARWLQAGGDIRELLVALVEAPEAVTRKGGN